MLIADLSHFGLRLRVGLLYVNLSDVKGTKDEGFQGGLVGESPLIDKFSSGS